jgi:hypothetical protein
MINAGTAIRVVDCYTIADRYSVANRYTIENYRCGNIITIKEKLNHPVATVALKTVNEELLCVLGLAFL